MKTVHHVCLLAGLDHLLHFLVIFVNILKPDFEVGS